MVIPTIRVNLTNDLGHRAAYEKGVLHRDLSEGNLLITGSKEVGFRAMVIDFDYAKFLEDAMLADDPISVRQLRPA